MDLERLLRKRRGLMFGVSVFEMCQLASGRMDTRLKMLAELKSSTLVGCEFCMDIGSALCRSLGIPQAQLLDLPSYRSSAAFDEVEKLVLALAVAMAKEPSAAPAVVESLRRHFDEPQLVELVSAIAWEHYRARFNEAFGVRPAGFSEGAFCVLPERA